MWFSGGFLWVGVVCIRVWIAFRVVMVGLLVILVVGFVSGVGGVLFVSGLALGC